LESRQESDVFLGIFQGVLAGVWENLWKLVKGPVREMILHFKGVSLKKREVGIA